MGNNKKTYNYKNHNKEDAMNVYKKELLKNKGDINKTLLALKSDTKMPFGFMQYFDDYKECIDYLGITENQFNDAKCIKWHGEVIERHTR